MSGTGSRFGRWAHRFSTLIGLVLALAAALVLGNELRQMPPGQLAQAFREIRPASLALATLFAFLNYLILTGYDQLAFLYIRRPISRWQVAIASFVGYAIANNVGFALLSGTSARYRFYSRWGLSGQEISRVVVFYSGTYWLGLIVLGGWALTSGTAVPVAAYLPASLTRLMGWTLVGLAVAYPVVALFRARPITVAGLEIPLPAPPLVAAQFVLSLLDWTLAAAVLYVLIPEPRPDFTFFVGAFLAAQLVALVSHVPGGLGVFESLMVLMLGLPAAVALPALLVFRLVYYLAPLAAALVVLLADEVNQRRHLMAQWGNAFGTLTGAVAPKLIAVFMLLAGGVLLLSGATPGDPARLVLVATIIPLPAIEIAHVAGSLIGCALLLVAWGLARRLDAAYYMGIVGLAAGMGASLLKGADFEEATVLGALLLALLLARQEFDRRSPLLETRPSPPWLVASIVVLAASVAVGAFAYRDVPYSPELWWRFELDASAPRSLRATAAALVFALLAGMASLLRRPRRPVAPPDAAELAEAALVVCVQSRTSVNLVFVGDKTLLWNSERSAFLMYGVRGHTWVALGDPVGPDHQAEPLVRRFLERCDDFQGVPVFYEATRQWLHVYADFGLTYARLADEARVFLPHFALAGSGHRRLRTMMGHLSRGGAVFRIVPAERLRPLLPHLKEVSDAWLAEHPGAANGFSVGTFDPGYLERFPVAVLEVGGRVEAFAVVWRGAGREEMGVDLLRYRPTAPRGTVDALFGWLLAWGRQAGYRWCNLGIAPLAEEDTTTDAPFWARAGRFIDVQAGALPVAQGLRADKQRFDPVWEPRYLAYPGGLALPHVANDIAALIRRIDE